MSLALRRAAGAIAGSKAILGLPTHALDFELSNSEYLSKTPSVFNFANLDKQSFLISIWLKPEFTLPASLTYDVFSKFSSTATARSFRVYFDSTGSPSVCRFGFTVYDSSGSAIGAKLSSANYHDNTQYKHFVAKWDSSNGTSTDRIQIWSDGVRIAAFDSDTDPSSGANMNSSASGTVIIGAQQSSSVTNFYDGLAYQAAVFSGSSLPSVADLYNSGTPPDISDNATFPGLFSLASVREGVVTKDEIQTAWTDNNSVSSSLTIP